MLGSGCERLRPSPDGRAILPSTPRTDYRDLEADKAIKASKDQTNYFVLAAACFAYRTLDKVHRSEFFAAFSLLRTVRTISSGRQSSALFTMGLTDWKLPPSFAGPALKVSASWRWRQRCGITFCGLQLTSRSFGRLCNVISGSSTIANRSHAAARRVACDRVGDRGGT